MTSKLKIKEKLETGRIKCCFIHSNRFFLNVVFKKVGLQVLSESNFDFDTYFNSSLQRIIEEVSVNTKDKAEELFPNSLIHHVFRNFTKCKLLRTVVE